MKNIMNNIDKTQEVLSVNEANSHKPTFASVDLWNIQKMVRNRVYRKYL